MAEIDPESAPLRILVISDGRLGRYRRSQTIVAAISRHRPVAVTTVEVAPNRRLHKLLRKFTGFHLPPEVVLTLLLGSQWRRFPTSELIISAGGMTLQTNIALAKLWGARNIFSGDRLKISSRLDLVLTMNPENTEPHNHHFALTCARTDPDELPPSNPEIRSLGVLIGGPNADITYRHEDWLSITRIIRDISTGNTDVTVVTSPRTPEQFYDVFRDVADKVKLLDYRSTGPATLENIFAMDAMIVTIDSTSMIVESVSARRPVIVLRPDHAKSVSDESLFNKLSHEKKLHISNLAELSYPEIKQVLQEIVPLQDNVLELIWQKISSNVDLDR